MERKHIAYAILVVAAAITLSAIAVEAVEWDHAQWLYDVGRHKIWQTNWILYNQIGPEVEAIEAKLDDSIFGLEALNIDLDAIIDYSDEVEPMLKSTVYGLSAIKTEVDAIETKLDSGVFGLAEIKSEVSDIYTWLTTDGNVVQDAELDAAKAEIIAEINANEAKIDAIEAKLDPLGAFWTFVNTWFTNIQTQITTHDTDIKTLIGTPVVDLAADIAAIEAKLDPGGAIYDMLTVLGDPASVPGRTWTTFADALGDIKLEIEIVDSKVGFLIAEVQAIEAKLDPGGLFWTFVNTWFTNIQTQITTHDTDIKALIGTPVVDLAADIAAIEAKLDPGGDFYTFVDTWFTTHDTDIKALIGTPVVDLAADINAIELKLDPGGDFYTFVDTWFTTHDTDIKALIGTPVVDLAADIAAIEAKLDPTGAIYEFVKELGDISADSGRPTWTTLGVALDDIKDEIEDIWTLDGNTHGWLTLPEALDEIKSEIEDITTRIGDTTFLPGGNLVGGLTQIINTQGTHSALLTNIWNLPLNPHDWGNLQEALADIKNEIKDIETKLDDKLAQGLAGEKIEWSIETNEPPFVVNYTFRPPNPKKISVWINLKHMTAADTIHVTVIYDSDQDPSAMEPVEDTATRKFRWTFTGVQASTQGKLIVDELPIASLFRVYITHEAGPPRITIYWQVIIEEM